MYCTYIDCDIFTSNVITLKAVCYRTNFRMQMEKRLEKYGFWDSTRRLKQISIKEIAIPINVDQLTWMQLGLTEWNDGCQIKSVDLPPSKASTLKTPLRQLQKEVGTLLKCTVGVVSPELIADLPSRWEKHGNLILVAETAFVSDVWLQLGAQLWKTVCECLGGSRLAKKSTVSTDGFRTPQVMLLYGDDGLVEHVDNGIRYRYDVTRCMFSIGNITEKLRLARLDCRGETVVDLYAGIGYFTLPYLVHAKADRVIACEWNPAAVQALKRNLQLNGVQDSCTVLEGDNIKVCPTNVANRVNLGLIPTSEPGWPIACAALKSNSGGTLHIHGNVTSKQFKDADNNKIDHRREGHLMSGSAEDHSTIIRGDNLINFLTSGDNSVLTYISAGGPKCNSNKSDGSFQDRTLDNKRIINSSYTYNSRLSPFSFPSQINFSCNQKLKTTWVFWSNEVREKIKSILESLHQRAWTVKILHLEHVKCYAPHIDHVVLDLDCRPRT